MCNRVEIGDIEVRCHFSQQNVRIRNACVDLDNFMRSYRAKLYSTFVLILHFRSTKVNNTKDIRMQWYIIDEKWLICENTCVAKRLRGVARPISLCGWKDILFRDSCRFLLSLLRIQKSFVSRYFDRRRICSKSLREFARTCESKREPSWRRSSYEFSNCGDTEVTNQIPRRDASRTRINELI